ncbi:MAG: hypothetical protein M1828_000824 [Chrysothrix sp. TS-e1954]|nr:MAG: hypothetical protein M1828_000824 [Chrysothrix sp. TS-e1954]
MVFGATVPRSHPSVQLKRDYSSPSILDGNPARAPTSIAPTCFYDQDVPRTSDGPLVGCGWLWGFPDPVAYGWPNPSYCYQSMGALCAFMSKLPANDTATYGYQTGAGFTNGSNADCFAIVANGNTFRAPLTFDQCYNGLARNAGCSERTNDNYNEFCVGGTTNARFNTNDTGTAIDYTKPRYGVGVRSAFGAVAKGLAADNYTAPETNTAAGITEQYATILANAGGVFRCSFDPFMDPTKSAADMPMGSILPRARQELGV